MYIRSKCDGLQDEYAKIKTYSEFTPKSSGQGLLSSWWQFARRLIYVKRLDRSQTCISEGISGQGTVTTR